MNRRCAETGALEGPNPLFADARIRLKIKKLRNHTHFRVDFEEQVNCLSNRFQGRSERDVEVSCGTAIAMYQE